MKALAHLFENNRAWAEGRREADPEYFSRIKDGQDPDYLWIGCADSRVPVDQMLGLQAGDLFVHRNVANLARNEDPSAQAVLEHAVHALKVDHIIVCGHYGCGGVAAALASSVPWAIERWIQPVRSLRTMHERALAALPDDAARWRRLCELNVLSQIETLKSNTIVQQAWNSGHKVALHGWIYDVADGLLRDLHVDA